MDRRRGLSALRRVPILAGVSEASLERVAGACKWQQFEAGEQLVQYQDPSTDVFFLAAGKLRVIVYSLEGKAVQFTDTPYRGRGRHGRIV